MIRPPEGICMPCEWLENHDGDTVTVRIPTGQRLKIRLEQCYAPELKDAGGPESKANLDRLCQQERNSNNRFWCWIKLARDTNHDGVVDMSEIFSALSFERVIGRVWASDADFSSYQTITGFATEEP